MTEKEVKKIVRAEINKDFILFVLGGLIGFIVSLCSN